MFPSSKNIDGSNIDLTNYYTKTEVDTIINSQGQAYIPCGTIDSFMTSTVPQGYLACDGSEYLKIQYPKLAEVLAAVDTANSTTIFVGSDSDHFKVPDLRGEFLRGTGTNGHTNNGNGAGVGVHQDATEIPRFGLDFDRFYWASDGVNGNNVRNVDSRIGQSSTNKSSQCSKSTSGDWANIELRYTSRPTNTSVLYCIAYKNIYIDLALDSFPLGISNPTDGQLLMYDATAGRWKNAGILHEYSTDEKIVGTWIDGKPLYEKFVDYIIPAGTSDRTWISTTIKADLSADFLMLDSSISYIEEWVNSAMFTYFPIPTCTNNNPGLFMSWNVSAEGIFSILKMGFTSELHCHFLMKYTKTTD